MPRIGPFELVIVLFIILVIFGVGKLPEIGGAMGKGIRAFKKGQAGEVDEGEKEKATEESKEPEKSKS
jgi:sec-independent protein translocase protein TatA